MTNVVDHLVSKFGSQARLGEAAGSSQSAVSGWKLNNCVPVKRQKILLRNAPNFGVELTPLDFHPDWRAESSDAAA